MYKTVILTLVAILPMSAFAQGLNVFEVECREELNLTGVSVQPGQVKADLRRCIRLKSSESRTRKTTKRRRANSQMKAKEIQKKVLESQQKTFGGASRYSYDLRMQYNLDCREKLGIGAKDVVRPGRKLAALKKCVARMRSEASRNASMRRRRNTVKLRSREIGTIEKQRKEADLQIELKRLDKKQRTRIQTQKKADPRRLRMIRETYRVRSFFTNPAFKTRSNQQMKAQECRKGPAKDWGACIRDALKK